MKRIMLAFLVLSASLFAQTADVTETVPTGATVTMVATADGVPTPTIEWQRNGTKVGEGNVFSFVANADTIGVYQAVARNVLGSSSSNKLTFNAGQEPSKVEIKFTVTVEVTPVPANRKK
jgi:hypothetical protein